MTAASSARSSPAAGTETSGSGRISNTSPMTAMVAMPRPAPGPITPAARRREPASQAATSSG